MTSQSPYNIIHEGSLGNLNLADITAEMNRVLAKF